jgi:hypothetical protein
MRATDGRLEKRVTAKVPVHVIAMENSSIAETTTTLDISRYGARVISSRRWRPGDELGLTSLSGEFHRRATVIYCHPLADRQFCIGLEFGPSVRNWKEAPSRSAA